MGRGRISARCCSKDTSRMVSILGSSSGSRPILGAWSVITIVIVLGGGRGCGGTGFCAFAHPLDSRNWAICAIDIDAWFLLSSDFRTAVLGHNNSRSMAGVPCWKFSVNVEGRRGKDFSARCGGSTVELEPGALSEAIPGAIFTNAEQMGVLYQSIRVIEWRLVNDSQKNSPTRGLRGATNIGSCCPRRERSPQDPKTGESETRAVSSIRQLFLAEIEIERTR